MYLNFHLITDVTVNVCVLLFITKNCYCIAEQPEIVSSRQNKSTYLLQLQTILQQLDRSDLETVNVKKEVFLLMQNHLKIAQSDVVQNYYDLQQHNFDKSYVQNDQASFSKNGTITPKTPTKSPGWIVWVASFTAMFIISSVGLMVVSAIPYLQRISYTHIIQFLVALAVGSLTGDAMLHLLPHCLIQSVLDDVLQIPGTDETDRAGVYKGLVALGGIYFFFLAEKIVTLLSDYRAEIKANEEEKERTKHHVNGRKPSSFNKWMEADVREQKIKSSSRQVVFGLPPRDSIITTGLSGRAMTKIDTLIRYAENDHEAMLEVDEDKSNIPSNCSTPKRKSSSTKLEAPNSGDAATVNVPLTSDEDNHNEVVIVVPSQNSGKEHHHSGKEEKPQHGHGHSHEVPQSVMSVAWMVILGDGLHNFTDGLGIGAAFAKNTAGGISTSLAVFCHELPHELGDFAVLLKTGMKIKQALLYNCLSSALSVVGMLIGIGLGNMQSASYWIFGITAGIFIYVALVDMLPQLSSANITPGESRVAHLIIQMSGLTVGVANMLLIALFEDKMKKTFESVTAPPKI